jgi:tetratricopeptide (TPR) repeat protein
MNLPSSKSPSGGLETQEQDKEAGRATEEAASGAGVTVPAGGIQPKQNRRPAPVFTFLIAEARKVETFAVVFLSLIALFTVTELQVRYHDALAKLRGEGYFEAGQQLVKEGKTAEAVAQYRAALSVAHHNTRYEFALAVALLNLGRLDEARAHLRQLLETDVNNAQINLMLARIAVREHDLQAAIDYYHRAIYGLWPDNPRDNRLKARFELVSVLDRAGETRQALAELLQLASEAPEQAPVKNRIGTLLLNMGSPANAEDVFRDVLSFDSKNADATFGLAQAEFDLGNYITARTEFRRAVRLAPHNAAAVARLNEADQILAMNPARVMLTAKERYNRTRELASATLDSLNQCVAQSHATPSADTQDAITAAQKLVAAPLRRRDMDATSSQLLSLAEQIWQARITTCGPPPQSEEALKLVMLSVMEGSK